MNSLSAVDADGNRLQVTHFPYNLKHRGTPSTFKMTKPAMLPLSSTSNNNKQLSTLMVVDFREDKQKLIGQVERIEQEERERVALGVQDSGNGKRPNTSEVRQRLKPNFKNLKLSRSIKLDPQPLNSSFLLNPRQQKDDVEVSLSEMLFNKHDVGTQTDRALERIDFKNLNDYQEWMDQVVEPFLIEYRKAIKANRPRNIEEYTIAYCKAMLCGEPAPTTVSFKSKA